MVLRPTPPEASHGVEPSARPTNREADGSGWTIPSWRSARRSTSAAAAVVVGSKPGPRPAASLGSCEVETSSIGRMRVRKSRTAGIRAVLSVGHQSEDPGSRSRTDGRRGGGSIQTFRISPPWRGDRSIGRPSTRRHLENAPRKDLGNSVPGRSRKPFKEQFVPTHNLAPKLALIHGSPGLAERAKGRKHNRHLVRMPFDSIRHLSLPKEKFRELAHCPARGDADASPSRSATSTRDTSDVGREPLIDRIRGSSHTRREPTSTPQFHRLLARSRIVA